MVTTQKDSLYLLDDYFTVLLVCQLLIDAITVSSRGPVNVTLHKECLLIVLGHNGCLLLLVLLYDPNTTAMAKRKMKQVQRMLPQAFYTTYTHTNTCTCTRVE